jgi:hypothetical protein
MAKTTDWLPGPRTEILASGAFPFHDLLKLAKGMVV